MYNEELYGKSIQLRRYARLTLTGNDWHVRVFWPSKSKSENTS